MGLIRYDSRVDECCCLGFLSARKALKSESVFAGRAEKYRRSTRCQARYRRLNNLQPSFPTSSHQRSRLEVLRVFTFSQDLRDFGVAGTEGAVDLEAIGIIKE